MALDRDDNLYVTDRGSHRVRKISPNGEVTSLAKNSFGFSEPTAVAVDAAGNVFVAYAALNIVTKITRDGTEAILAAGIISLLRF